MRLLANAGYFVIPNKQIFLAFPCHVANNIKLLYRKEQKIAKSMSIVLQVEGEDAAGSTLGLVVQTRFYKS